MRRLFLVLIIIIPSLIFSQEKNNPLYTISGKIIDASTLLPLEDATVIFKSLDSNKIKFGTITNHRGKFSIEVEKGTYNASVEFLSYLTKTLNILSITRDLDIGTIALEIDVEFLDEIEIIGEKSTLEFKKNKQVYTVGKDISANGSTVTQILTNIPSVDIDPNGNIKLNGRSNVTVMINGRISTLSKSDALKSLAAGSIEKIEIINNPGASYSATTEAIINLIFKKGKEVGLNASLTGTGGYKDYYGSLLTLNNKSKKVNFYTNIQYLHRNPITLATYSNKYYENNSTISYLNENTINRQPANAFISTIGFEFYTSEKSTLSTSVNYTNIDAKNNSNTFSNILDASENSIATNTRNNTGTFTDEIIEFIIDFEQKFNKEGQNIRVYATYSDDNEKYNNTYTNSNSSFIDENFALNNTLKNTNTKITFTNPIGDNAEFEIGYEGSFGKTPYRHIENNTTKLIDFTDTNNAFFASYGKQLNKFYYGIELRAEFLKFKINYDYLNTVQNKEFNNLFPYIGIDYSFTDFKNISLSYNKNYQLPGYGDLQPFEQKISETIYYKGNEDINPVYADSFNLTYSYFGRKITVQTSLQYLMYKDVLQLVTYKNGEQINGLSKLIITPINLGKLNYAAAILMAIYKPSKIISFTANATITHFDQSGIFQIVNSANKTIIQDFNYTSFNANFSLLTQLKIPNWFNLQTNIKHFIKSEGPVSIRQAYTYANIAISRDIFNKNATISITSDDIFNSNTVNRTRFHTFYSSDVFVRQKHPTILASFTYRFNQRKQDRKINFDTKEKESKTKF